MKVVSSLLFLLCILISAGTSTAQDLTGGGIRLEVFASGFESPVQLVDPRDGSNRLFVVEQVGRIRIIQNGVVLPSAFLDLSREIRYGGEQGLLSLAFHPSFARNGKFYVYLNDRQGNVAVWSYRTSRNKNLADKRSRRTVISIPHRQFQNHNGGTILFGPDRMLYISIGDGGGAGDPFRSAQSLQSRLGKILRINVDAGTPYRVPADNPFARLRRVRTEIWAYGLRNPWRVSFDRGSGRFFVADVGQGALEEVDIVTRGGNYGWNTMEGSQCYSPSSGCITAGLELPIAEYGHDEGQSITGGFVYRGALLPSFSGKYFFGDFVSGRLWILTENAGTWSRSELIDTDLNISSFGEDSLGELYLLDYSGTVFQILPASS